MSTNVSHTVPVRFTSEQFERWQNAAQKEGYTLYNYFRMIAAKGLELDIASEEDVQPQIAPDVAKRRALAQQAADELDVEVASIANVPDDKLRKTKAIGANKNNLKDVRKEFPFVDLEKSK